MKQLRCLFHVDPYGPIDVSKEPEVFIADPDTVSSERFGDERTGERLRIGWATPPKSEMERSSLAEHPDCVWVTTIIAPILIVGPGAR